MHAGGPFCERLDYNCTEVEVNQNYTTLTVPPMEIFQSSSWSLDPCEFAVQVSELADWEQARDREPDVIK